jgi:hypothetical protein
VGLEKVEMLKAEEMAGPKAAFDGNWAWVMKHGSLGGGVLAPRHTGMQSTYAPRKRHDRKQAMRCRGIIDLHRRHELL